MKILPISIIFLGLFNSCKSSTSPSSPAPPEAVPTAAPTVDSGISTQPGATTTVVPTLSTTTTPSVTVDLSGVLADDIKTTCTGQGKMVERAKRTCITGSVLNTGTCTIDSAKTAFGASASAMEADVNPLLSQGYVIDQCGTINGKAAISLYHAYDKSGVPAIDTHQTIAN